MKPRLVDLHVHTSASDGSERPSDVVREAYRLGLAALAITDHDTVDGLEEAEAAAGEYPIEVIRGCELSCTSPYGEVHVLGLWLPRDSRSLADSLAELRRRRERRNLRMMERLDDLGLPVDMESVVSLAAGDSVGRPHIARAMVARGYVSSVQEAFTLYLGRNGSAFLPMDPFPPEEAVRMLAGVGALSSLAHPMLIRCPFDWLDSLVARMSAEGLGAIEAYHSDHSQQDERRLVALAARHGLGLSGGSDYHGRVKPHITLGRGRGSLRVTEALLDLLRARHRAAGQPA